MYFILCVCGGSDIKRLGTLVGESKLNPTWRTGVVQALFEPLKSAPKNTLTAKNSGISSQTPHVRPKPSCDLHK